MDDFDALDTTTDTGGAGDTGGTTGDAGETTGDTGETTETTGDTGGTTGDAGETTGDTGGTTGDTGGTTGDTGGTTGDAGETTGDTGGTTGDTGGTDDTGGATGDTGGPGGDGVPQSGGDPPPDGTGQNLSGGPTNIVGDSCAAWYATKTNMLKLLGFDVSKGPIVIEANTPTSAPGLLDLSSRQYIWMKLKVNDQYVGDFYELDCEGSIQGPFFSKVLLMNESPDYLDYSYYNSGSHVFADATTIKSIQIELYDPIIGKDVTSGISLSRHNSRGRDNEFDLFLQELVGTDITNK